jgi:hypothetical protein
LRRGLIGLSATAVLCLAAPALASAANPSLTVTPSNLQAGGDPNLVTHLQLLPAGSSDSAKSIKLQLPPGLLTSLSANPSCVAGSPNRTAACQVGTGTATVTGVADPVPLTMYLVPSQAPTTDLAGVELDFNGLPFQQYVGGSVDPNGVLTLTGNNLPAVPLTSLDLTFNGTLGGKPFTRMPTSCSAATTTLTVVSTSGSNNGSGTSAFTPTGCSSLTYAPTLSGTAVRDANDGGVTVDTIISAGATDAATKSSTIKLPAGMLSPNTAAIGLLNSGKAVGSATAITPLLPGSATAQVFLTGSLAQLSLTIQFPAPFPLTLVGNVGLSDNSFTFASVPDVPLSSLDVKLNGGAQALLTTTCNPSSGTVTGNFTGQNGATHASSSTLTIQGCSSTGGGGGGGGGGTPPPPNVGKPSVAKGSLGGLPKGKPKVSFKVSAGENASNFSTITVSAPKGLKFSKKAFPKKGKKGSVKGLKVSGGKIKSVKLKGGKLVITLKSAVSSATVKIGPPLLTESKSLKSKAKKNKAGTLTFKVKVSGSTLSLKLKG